MATRGRKLGQVGEGSNTAWLVAAEVGDRRYIETDEKNYGTVQSRALVPRSRRPASLEGKEFITTVFQAVSAKKIGEVRILVCIERIT